MTKWSARSSFVYFIGKLQMILMLYTVSLILIDEGNVDWYNMSIKMQNISIINVHNADRRRRVVKSAGIK